MIPLMIAPLKRQAYGGAAIMVNLWIKKGVATATKSRTAAVVIRYIADPLFILAKTADVIRSKPITEQFAWIPNLRMMRWPQR